MLPLFNRTASTVAYQDFSLLLFPNLTGVECYLKLIKLEMFQQQLQQQQDASILFLIRQIDLIWEFEYSKKAVKHEHLLADLKGSIDCNYTTDFSHFPLNASLIDHRYIIQFNSICCCWVGKCVNFMVWFIYCLFWSICRIELMFILV